MVAPGTLINLFFVNRLFFYIKTHLTCLPVRKQRPIVIHMARKRAKTEFNTPSDREESARTCERDECEAAGEYRAPKSRDDMKSYRWFCLEHIREYNRAWNYYEGMTDVEVEFDVRRDTVWHRPSWRLGAVHMNGYGFDPSKFDDPLGVFGDNDSAGGTSPDDTWTPRTPESEALAIMDLRPPVTTAIVKARYKELVKRHHPDANGGNKDSEEQFKKISQAYNIIIECLAS